MPGAWSSLAVMCLCLSPCLSAVLSAPASPPARTAGAVRIDGALLGQPRDRAGKQADFAAQFLHALCPPLGDILGQPGDIGLDIAQMGAQNIVLPERILGDAGQPSQRRLQLDLALG